MRRLRHRDHECEVGTGVRCVLGHRDRRERRRVHHLSHFVQGRQRVVTAACRKLCGRGDARRRFERDDAVRIDATPHQQTLRRRCTTHGGSRHAGTGGHGRRRSVATVVHHRRVVVVADPARVAITHQISRAARQHGAGAHVEAEHTDLPTGVGKVGVCPAHATTRRVIAAEVVAKFMSERAGRVRRVVRPDRDGCTDVAHADHAGGVVHPEHTIVVVRSTVART